MKGVLWTVMAVLLCLGGAAVAKDAPPKVQVYSRVPGEIGKANTLICHVSGFHPPEITISLTQNGQNMENTNQTDLAFEENWQYHLTKYVPFTPNNDKFACEVTHMKKTRVYTWDRDS